MCAGGCACVGGGCGDVYENQRNLLILLYVPYYVHMYCTYIG